MSASWPQKFAGYADRKPSGAEWFKTAPKHWEVKMIKWDSPVRRGASPRPIDDPKYFDDNGEYAWVRISDVTRSRTGYLFETEQRLSSLGSSLSVKLGPGALFLSIAATVGKPCIAQIRCCIHDGFVYFPFLKMLPRFMWYIFEAGEAYKGLGKLGTQLNLNTNTVGTIKIPVPPTAEQLEIAGFLDRETARIDELVAKKEKLLQLIGEKKRAEVARLVAQGLTPGVLLRNTGTDYLGCIPTHWTTPPIYARYSVALGKMLDARQITGAFLLPYLRNIDVQWDQINTDDLPQMDISPDEYDRFLLRKGDLLVCEGGEVGRCSIWTGDLSPCAYQKALHRMRPLRSDEHVRYMFYTLAHVAGSGYFAASGSPNTISHLTAEKLRVFRFPKPPLDEQVQISDHLDAYIASLRQTEGAILRAVDLLREHRTALISAAVTGQIDVRTYRKEPEAVLEVT